MRQEMKFEEELQKVKRNIIEESLKKKQKLREKYERE